MLDIKTSTEGSVETRCRKNPPMAKSGDRPCGEILLSIKAEFEGFKRKILLNQGIDVNHESLRSGCISLVRNMQSVYERILANGSQIKWHRDEVHLKIQGQAYWLWRAP